MYGDSHALSSSDSCSIYESISKQKDEALLREQVRDKQLLSMDSGANTFYSVFRHDLMSRVNDNSSGLLRFRSAPTSLLENFKNEKLDSRICYGDDDVANSMHVIVSENNDDDDNGCNNKRFTAMNSQLPPQYPRQGYRSALSSSDQQGQNGKFGSGLLRQHSSPAGLFSSQNGYAGGNVEFKNHMNYSSGLGPSSLGMLSRISEIENENPGPDQGKVGNSSGDNLFFTSGFQFGSWNDSTSYFAENFSTNAIKREVDNDPTNMFVNTEKCEVGNRPNILSHHLSLPKSSAEMEKLLHLQDTVPCKIRAKRGCATHPRSIAERVRRTRISERMRKLQDLVPNMDKQTNTADMLDLAVDYINSLQKQYKSLSNDRANCKCSAFQKVVSDERH